MSSIYVWARVDLRGIRMLPNGIAMLGRVSGLAGLRSIYRKVCTVEVLAGFGQLITGYALQYRNML